MTHENSVAVVVAHIRQKPSTWMQTLVTLHRVGEDAEEPSWGLGVCNLVHNGYARTDRLLQDRLGICQTSGAKFASETQMDSLLAIGLSQFN